jgi:hypothetical protein
MIGGDKESAVILPGCLQCVQLLIIYSPYWNERDSVVLDGYFGISRTQ